MLVQQARSAPQCYRNTHLRAPHVARCAYRHSRTTALPAAAAAAAEPGLGTGAFPGVVVDALERYGEHAKAAYILFGKYEDEFEQPIAIKGKDLADISGLASLRGYTGVANMLGYAGVDDVLSEPLKPDTDLPQAEFDVASVPNLWDGLSLVGYIATGVPASEGDAPELVIAFRGSSVTADWINNLLGGVAAKDVYKEGSVHRGFHNMLYVVPDGAEDEETPITAIDAALAEYHNIHNKFPPRIVTVGHSLGGALATLAAAHIAIKHEQYRAVHADYTQRPLQTYTFAAPRVGDAALCSYFNSELGFTAVQVQNVQDPVPLCAPRLSFSTPGEVSNAVSKVVQLLAAYGWHPSVDGGNAAPAAADTAAEAAAASMLSKRLLVYEQFAQALDSRELLKAYFDAAIEAGELATAAGLSPFETLHYAKDLLLTGLTDWTDNPAPPIGVFDSTEGGNWGGYMHSLELYLKHIRELQRK